MIVLKAAKVNGKPSKLVVVKELAREEKSFILDTISSAFAHGDYIVLPFEGSVKEAIKETMLSRLSSGFVSNGSFFTDSSEIEQIINSAETVSDLFVIYQQYNLSI